MIVNVPISIGELIDKLTILDIKKQEISDTAKLKNIEYEYQLLNNVLATLSFTDITNLRNDLFKVNLVIWNYENVRRDCENEQDFGEKFIEAVRQIHINNEERSRIKRVINDTNGSSIIEEKSYT